MVIARGDVVWTTLPDPAGAEPGFRRPAVVVQADAFNASALQTVMLAPLTTRLDRQYAPGNILLRASLTGLPRDSVALCAAVITVDKTTVDERVGALGAAAMRKLDAGLRLALDL